MHAQDFAGLPHEHWDITYRDINQSWTKPGDLRAAMAPFLANNSLGRSEPMHACLTHVHHMFAQQIRPDIAASLVALVHVADGQHCQHAHKLK